MWNSAILSTAIEAHGGGGVINEDSMKMHQKMGAQAQKIKVRKVKKVLTLRRNFEFWRHSVTFEVL